MKIQVLVLLLMLVVSVLNTSSLRGQGSVYFDKTESYNSEQIKRIGLPVYLDDYTMFEQGDGYARRAEKMNEIVDEWMEGEVTFRDGRTILCELSYNPLLPEGLLKIVIDEKMLTGTAFNVESFTCYDYENSIDHTYFFFPITDRNRVFAQLLYESECHAVLGRKSAETSKEHWNSYSMMMGIGSNFYFGTKIKLQHQYILFDFKTGDSHILTRKSLLRIMADKKKEIKAFIRANKLKFRNTEDYIAVVKEYERLIQ